MRTIADRVNKAEAALAAGFTSEAGRKEILTYYVSRAFDDVLSNAANVTGVWDVPTIANWRPKHSILFAGCPESVALANQLVDLRNRIKAATLVAKPKSKAAAQLEARAAVAKICQICGRPILAERGNIAHHGYQRPGEGWQTASCFGAMHLSFEVSRDHLGQYIEMITKQLADLRVRLAGIENETTTFRVRYFTGKYNGRAKVMGSFFAERGTYEAVRDEHRKLAYHWSSIPQTFDAVKASELHSTAGMISDTERHITEQQARYNAWTPSTKKKV